MATLCKHYEEHLREAGVKVETAETEWTLLKKELYEK